MQMQSGIFKICPQKLLCRKNVLSSVDVNFLCVADKRSRVELDVRKTVLNT